MLSLLEGPEIRKDKISLAFLKVTLLSVCKLDFKLIIRQKLVYSGNRKIFCLMSDLMFLGGRFKTYRPFLKSQTLILIIAIIKRM